MLSLIGISVKLEYDSFLVNFLCSVYCSTFKELCKAEERKEDFTVYTFHNFMLNHKYLLIPAFQLQRTMREKICGRGFWRKQIERRERMHPAAAYVSVAQLLNPVRNSQKQTFAAIKF